MGSLDEIKIEHPSDNQDKKDEETPGIPQKYFDAYREANLKFPQHGFAISVLIAQAALSDPEFDAVAFAQTQLKGKQLDAIKLAMNRAHAARGVTVGSPEEAASLEKTTTEMHNLPTRVRVISDERMQSSWMTFQYQVLGIMGALAGLRDNDGRFVYDYSGFDHQKMLALANEVSQRLAEPQTRNYVERTFDSFAKTLRSKWGGEMGKKNRDAVEFRWRPNAKYLGTHPGARAEVQELQEEMFERMWKEWKQDLFAKAVMQPRLITEEELPKFKKMFIHL